MQAPISDRFRSLAETAGEFHGLAEGALVLAAEAKEACDVDAGLAALEALTERIRPEVEAQGRGFAAVERLNRALFETERFRGNRDEYDDPRNSYLDDVLERRCGLPITLSVLYVEVARKLGFEAHGVGFPGHFLSKVVGPGLGTRSEVIVDAFFGRIVTLEECTQRLEAAAGEPVEFDARWLRPASSREIFVRMLNNLKLHHLREGDGLAALGCFDRILLLAPDAAGEIRDRGLLLEQLDCILPAVEDLTRYLELEPGAEDAELVRRRRDALSQRRPSLH